MKLLRLSRTATPPAPKLTVALTYAERQRYRLRKQVDADTEIAIVLERGQGLRPGEVLVAQDGTGVRIKSDVEELMEVNPQTYEVRADGQPLVCEPAKSLPLAQRYFLF